MTDAAPPTQDAQAAALREQRITNQIGEPEFHARMGEIMAAPAPAAQALTAEQANKQMEQLRRARLENKVTDRTFFEQMDRLGAIASGEAPVGNSTVHLSPEVAAEVEAATTPPPTPAGYRFEYPANHNATPESMKFDGEVRTTFHQLGLPQHMAAPIFRSVNEMAAKLQNANPEHIAQHIERVGTQLRAQWGDRYQAKLASVDSLIDGLPDGRVADVLRSEPWLLGGDPRTMDTLAYFAEQRARRRGAA